MSDKKIWAGKPVLVSIPDRGTFKGVAHGAPFDYEGEKVVSATITIDSGATRFGTWPVEAVAAA